MSDRTVVFVCLHGAASRLARWDDVPAVSEDYGRARDVIAARVRMLVGQASGAQ